MVSSLSIMGMFAQRPVSGAASLLVFSLAFLLLQRLAVRRYNGQVGPR